MHKAHPTVIHIGKSREKPMHKPKLAKEYACPTHGGHDIAAN
ncbi:MAG: hypothetical protein WAO52_11500 [Prolixibacteraceae bacterium]